MQNNRGALYVRKVGESLLQIQAFTLIDKRGAIGENVKRLRYRASSRGGKSAIYNYLVTPRGEDFRLL
jgi:hypothetical protein